MVHVIPVLHMHELINFQNLAKKKKLKYHLVSVFDLDCYAAL